ncbi:tail protein X [Pseudomonas sp. AO-1]|uniref:tail protein X n=1 Tax=Pseudomonas sp. AO-1 TaxID=2855434 RepID=UPI001C79A8D7|nr:tail protein X [Pseudomonas sp. AO-1]QXZ12491.1 tail protein X [Pseudomonas sp. AO-1]
MAMTCRTSDGDLLDTLCYHAYGHLSGTVEAVLDANQGLADELQPYRAGIVIELPDLPLPSEDGIALWS